MPKSISRLNARTFPSGENAGSLSPPSALVGGDVTFCFSPVSTDNRDKAYGAVAESRSVTANHLPSGDQARLGDGKSLKAMLGLKISAILRSGPPKAGIRSTAAFSGERSRRNAMNRPSGDQLGL